MSLLLALRRRKTPFSFTIFFFCNEFPTSVTKQFQSPLRLRGSFSLRLDGSYSSHLLFNPICFHFSLSKCFAPSARSSPSSPTIPGSRILTTLKSFNQEFPFRRFTPLLLLSLTIWFQHSCSLNSSCNLDFFNLIFLIFLFFNGSFWTFSCFSFNFFFLNFLNVLLVWSYFSFREFLIILNYYFFNFFSSIIFFLIFFELLCSWPFLYKTFSF